MDADRGQKLPGLDRAARPDVDGLTVSLVQRQEVCLCAVFDKDVVPRHALRILRVCVDRGDFAFQKLGDEDSDNPRLTGRVLPGSIDICIAQRRPCKPILVPIETQVVLSKELVNGIRGLRSRGMVLREPVLARLPVDGASGGDEDELPHPGLAAVLQHVEKAQAVDPGVQDRVSRGDRDAHLGRVMVHDVGFLDLEYLFQQGGGDVHQVERDPLGKVGLVSRGQVVDDGHGMAGFQADIRHVGTDEPRPSRDENFHELTVAPAPKGGQGDAAFPAAEDCRR